MTSIVLSDIRDALTAVQPIIAKAADNFRNYHISGGQIKASNGNMRAGTPIMFDEEMIVPADEFNKIIKTIRKDPDVTIGPQRIIFKSGGSRITLPRIHNDNEIKVEELDGETIDLDGKFLENLKILFPLIEDSDTPDFQNSLICINGEMIASHKGQIIISAFYAPFKEAEIKCLLPAELVRFLINKKVPPEEMILTEKAVQFLWPDDSWVVSTLITGNVPQKLFTLLEGIKETDWSPTVEHKNVVQDIQAMGGSKITFNEDGCEAQMDQGKFESEVKFLLPEGKTSQWQVKHLKIIFDIADNFDFTSYPKPGTFTGGGIKGVIAPMMG